MSIAELPAKPDTRALPPSPPMHRQAAWSILGWFCTALYGFAITRLLVRGHGISAYGLWATVGALRGYILVLDTGLALAVNRDTALLTKGAENGEARARVRVALRIYGSLAVGALLCFISLSGFPGYLLGLEGASGSVASRLMVWFGIEVALVLSTSPFVAQLRGQQRFRDAAVLQVLQTCLALALIVLLSPELGLDGAAGAVVIARAIALGGALWANKRPRIRRSKESQKEPRGDGPGRDSALRSTIAFAVPLWLTAAATQLGAGADVPIVGGLFGDEAAGNYALGALLPSVCAGMLFALIASFFPKTVAADGQWTEDQKNLAGTLVFMASFLAALGFGFVITRQHDILSLWVGTAPPLAVDVGRILAFAWIINAPTHVLCALAIARGVHGIVGKVVAVEAIANLTLSVGLALAWSAAGPAVATLATMVVTNAVVLPPLLRNRLGLSRRYTARPTWAGYAIGSVGAVSIAAFLAPLQLGAVGSVAVGGTLTACIAGAALDLTVRGRSTLATAFRITIRGGWATWRRQRRQVHDERVSRQNTTSSLVLARTPPPLVTVTIPTYSRGPMIAERAIASALDQTHPNVEVVVVGDCCDTATVDAVESVRDERVRFENLAERGRYGSDPLLRWMVAGTSPRLRALELARGDWIAPLDDDDEFTSDHCEALLDACRSRDLEFAWGLADCERTDGTWSPRGAWPPKDGNIIHASVLYTASIRHIAYDIDAWRVDEPGDWNLWRRFFEIGIRMGFVDHIVCRHYAEKRDVEPSHPWWIGR